MRKVDSFVDLECGKVLSEDEIKDLHLKKKFDRKRSGVGVLNGFTKDGDGVSTSKIVLISGENAEILMGGKRDEAAGFAKKKNVNGKCKKSKPPKPPRPPGAPLLDEADMKLVKEISELARLKHARKEWIKAMKKKRRLQKASSSTSIYATMVTFIFCVIVIYQELFDLVLPKEQNRGEGLDAAELRKGYKTLLGDFRLRSNLKTGLLLFTDAVEEVFSVLKPVEIQHHLL